MIVFWIIGILFLVIGLIVCIPRYMRFIKCKGRTTGKIIQIEANGQSSRAVFEYSAEGKRYTRKTSWTSDGIFIVGENCDVIYSIKNPAYSYIQKSGQVIQCIVGTLFAVAGLGAFFLGIILNGVL